MRCPCSSLGVLVFKAGWSLGLFWRFSGLKKSRKTVKKRVKNVLYLVTREAKNKNEIDKLKITISSIFKPIGTYNMDNVTNV